MAKTNDQKEAEAATKRQQALTDAQASGDPEAVAKAQAELNKAFLAAEADAEAEANAAAEEQKAADQAVADAQTRSAAAESAAFRAQAQASTEMLIAQDPARQVPYLPTQVMYRLSPAPTIEPATFRQVKDPVTGHITNEGIGAKE